MVRTMRKAKAHGSHPRRPWYAKEWIAHKHLKQADIVARTEMTKGMVSDYVNNARRWNQDVLEAFADAIGIDPADLLRPPHAVDNELAVYVMGMDARERARALRVLKAAMEGDGDENGGKKVA